MNRQEKTHVVDELQWKLQECSSAFVVNYKGLKVNEVQKLRRTLAAQGGELKVAKARIMKRAVETVDGMKVLNEHLKNQIALVFSKAEAPSIAKVLYDFSKEHGALDIVVGFSDAKLLNKEDVILIASLPSREVLLAKLCGVLMAPLSAFARAVDQIVQNGEVKNEKK